MKGIRIWKLKDGTERYEPRYRLGGKGSAIKSLGRFADIESAITAYNAFVATYKRPPSRKRGAPAGFTRPPEEVAYAKEQRRKSIEEKRKAGILPPPSKPRKPSPPRPVPIAVEAQKSKEDRLEMLKAIWRRTA